MSIKDHNQNFWQLACIAGTALGLPAMAIGGQLARQYGPGTAVLSVLIGNFILWAIGLGIVSMAQNRSQAIENVKGYLGKNASIFAALFWIFAFLIWYIIQIQGVTYVVANSFHEPSHWKIGAFLGLLVAVLSMGGIRIIKGVCMIALPLLISYAIFATATSEKFVSFKGTWSLSIACVLSVILTWLPGTVNLPTFFRHSKSKADSVIGLSLMTLFHIFFQTFAILTGIYNLEEFSNFDLNFTFSFALNISFAVLSYICINLVNIYFASAGWEAIIPKHRSFLLYFMVGLFSTSAYVLFQSPWLIHKFFYPFEFIESIFANSIANLSIVLLIAYIIRIVTKHRPRNLEKFWNSICWLAGCIAAFLTQTQNPLDPTSPLIAGITTSTICFLLVIFIEETIWSIKNLKLKQITKNR